MPLRCLRAVPFSQLANQGPSKLFGPHRRQPTLGTTGGGVTGGLHRGLRLRQAPRDRGAVERAAEAPKQPPPPQGPAHTTRTDHIALARPSELLSALFSSLSPFPPTRQRSTDFTGAPCSPRPSESPRGAPSWAAALRLCALPPPGPMSLRVLLYVAPCLPPLHPSCPLPCSGCCATATADDDLLTNPCAGCMCLVPAAPEAP